MKQAHDQFPYDLVILVGDNLYGSERPQDFKKKFEDPYKPLLDAGVKFYASLGNHDDRRSSGTTSCSTWTASATTRSSRTQNKACGSSRSRARTSSRSRWRGSSKN